MAGRAEPASNFHIGRNQELEALEQVLLGEGGHVAALHGAPGSGKTSLANLFLGRHRDKFPGGGTIVNGADVDLETLVRPLSPEGRSLLVIDEVDRGPISSLGDVLRGFRVERPLASILTTSSIPVMVAADTFILEMPPLRTDQIIDLLARQSGLSPPRLEKLAALLGGNATAVEEASRRLASGVPAERIVQWFESGRLTIARDAEGGALLEGSPARQHLDIAVSEISEALIGELAARPSLLYELDPRKFEMLVAELFRRRGFETTLTPASGDEGVDIYAVSRSDLGQALWVVQAKRYAAERKVEAGVVRELLGTVTAKNASAGVLITTSFFQPGAIALEQQLQYRLSLKDYIALQEMLGGPAEG
jgi:restriction system protein